MLLGTCLKHTNHSYNFPFNISEPITTFGKPNFLHLECVNLAAWLTPSPTPAFKCHLPGRPPLCATPLCSFLPFLLAVTVTVPLGYTVRARALSTPQRPQETSARWADRWHTSKWGPNTLPQNPPGNCQILRCWA